VILDVRGLAFGYPGRRVGHDVTFSLAPGEVFCLLGPNGSGKTTLFKTILRLLTPLGGEVIADGRSTRHWSRATLARFFGYVPQAHDAAFPFTVREMVLMGRTAHLAAFAMPTAQDHRIADEALDLLGIAHLAGHRYPEVSGGERQLTLVARAVAQAPRVLVMDEPTASLDFGNQVRVLEELRELSSRGMAVILSTHDPDQAFVCAHRVAMLHDGQLAYLGTPAEVITREALRAVYGVTVDVVQVGRGDGPPLRVCVPELRPLRRVSEHA